MNNSELVRCGATPAETASIGMRRRLVSSENVLTAMSVPCSIRGATKEVAERKALGLTSHVKPDLIQWFSQGGTNRD